MTPRAGVISIAAVLLAGCQDAAEEASVPPPPEIAQPAAEASPFGEPADEEIFAWLEDGRYRETWELLPGSAPMHPGADPHGALLTAYANPISMEALERGMLSMPPEAAIAVEDYMADSTLSTISVMVRVADRTADSMGWRFARFAPTGEIDAGPVDACRSCHVLEPDLVFGHELGTPLPIDSTGARVEATE